METSTLTDSLAALCQDIIGTNARIVDTQIVKQSPDYSVTIVQLQNPNIKVVIKLAGPTAPIACPFDHTAHLHQLVAAQANAPIADIISVDTSYQRWPWRYIIKAHADGVEWASAQHEMSAVQRRAAYQQLGDAVAQLHSIQFPQFDPYIDHSPAPQNPTYLDALKIRASARIESDRLRSLFLTTLEQYEHLFTGITQAQLCHEDLHHFNILFQQQGDRWNLTSLLDFDSTWAGYGESDLARMEIWTGMTSPDFWQAYKLRRAVEPLYVQRRPLYQLLWCLEFARATDRHLRDTQSVCRELGISVDDDLFGQIG